ncbi:MAG: (d)CMP kinase [bacterium]|nr:(d)CMP kinase [bacterium]
MTPTHPLITIAIDGYSSSGKSTMARRLASDIGYRYIDSGAMYRAVTLYAMRHGMIDAAGSINEAALTAALPGITVDFAATPAGAQHTLLNGQDVEADIRTMAISAHVSEVAAIPAVRHALVRMQQQAGHSGGIVMDGRDIGTTVFPHAELKIFVTASPQTRALRRLAELQAKGIPSTYEEVLANVMHRDHIDETRAESPLRRAPDALTLDNSLLTPEQQHAHILKLYNDTISRLSHDADRD